MKNIAILVDGKIKFVADWPDEPECKKYCDYTGICESIASHDAVCHCKIYEKEVKQAIANAIEFKDQEEIKKVIYETETGCSSREFHPTNPPVYFWQKWQMEPLKPYAIPEGILIKFGFEGLGEQFAFIKGQPKEETQHDLWLEALSDYSTMESKFRIERIK